MRKKSERGFLRNDRLDRSDSEYSEFRYVEEFMGRSLNLEHTFTLLNLLDNVCVFFKGVEDEYVFGTQCFLEGVGLKSQSDFAHSTDLDHFAPVQASAFSAEDRAIFRTGEVIRNRLEWLLVLGCGVRLVELSKFSIRDDSGKVIGICGVTEDRCRITAEGVFLSGSPGDERLSGALDFLFSSIDRTPENDEIARAANVSKRQLGRLFAAEFGTTPQRFLGYIKLDAAFRRLRSCPVSISDIALDLGFSDQSSFTAWFRKLTGMTPRGFQKRAEDPP